MPYFDRFDICEAYAVYAHDWGDYRLLSRLHKMGFRARPSLALGTLSTNSRAIYDGLVTRTASDDSPF